jgi:hypothetical protein
LPRRALLLTLFQSLHTFLKIILLSSTEQSNPATDELQLQVMKKFGLRKLSYFKILISSSAGSDRGMEHLEANLYEQLKEKEKVVYIIH